MCLMTNLTIEDCLELLTGINAVKGYSFTLENEDYNILTSVARQVFKGTALTDRQFDMLVKKLEKYTLQFEQNGIDINGIITNMILRTPFRTVDRTQTVYIEDGLIVAQFPFNKKLISKIQTLRDEATGQVTNNKNKWKFELSERNIFVVGSTLTNFNVTQEFKELFDIISKYKYEEFVPGIYNINNSLVLKNMHPDAERNIIKACGPLQHNILKYIDRAKQFGIEHIDYELNEDTIETKLVKRKGTQVHISDNYSLNEVTDALDKLDRYPLVVIVDAEKLSDVFNCYAALSGTVSIDEQTVMFRVPNTTDQGIEFNQWVKQTNLNNWIDTNTKVVYISDSKVPKVVVNNINPGCILNFSSTLFTYGRGLGAWITQNSDLRIDYGIRPLVMNGVEIIE
jgi:hypothetical protein